MSWDRPDKIRNQIEEFAILDMPPQPAGRIGHWFQFEQMGQPFRFWIDERPDSLQDIIQRTGNFYEAEALQLMRDTLPPKPRIVDVGANIGNHAVYFDRVCGAEKVFAIEPNADVIEDLVANTAANGCRAVDLSLIGFAVGSESGAGALFLSASDDAIRNRGGVSISQQGDASGQVIPIWRLDDLDLGDIDLIKVDVEGGAIGVLAGAASLIGRCRPVIFVEIDVPDLPAFTDWLSGNRYSVSAAVEYHAGILNFLAVPRFALASAGQNDATVPPQRRVADTAATQWSATHAEKRRADRSEETLAIAIVTMRNTEARATKAEAQAALHLSALRKMEARAAEAESNVERYRSDLLEVRTLAATADARAATHLAALRKMESRVSEADASVERYRSALLETQVLAAEADARAQAQVVALKGTEPRSLLSTLFFRPSGKPKKAIRRLFFHTAGRPRGALKKFVLHPDGSPRDAFTKWMTSPEYLELRGGARVPQTKFVAREARELPRETHAPTLPKGVGKRVLFIDAILPDPGRDSGSVDTVNYVSWLTSLGYVVHFLTTSYIFDEKLEQPVVGAGGIVLRLPNEQAVFEYLQAEGAGFRLFFLTRVYCGGRFLEACKRANPRGFIIFNTVDLHHIREEREARLRNDREALFRACATRERELYVARQSDLTIVVSSLEVAVVEAAIPGAKVAVMPLYRSPPAVVAAFAERGGIGFIGGFEHVPNIDAIRYFLAEVWPKIHSAEPSLRFQIAGHGLPDEITQSFPAGVEYMGQVANLEDWFNKLRLTVAPLRYGAGAKGKVASSIVNGVPVVGTTIAFEGMGLGPNCVMATDTAEAMALQVVRLHSDKLAWEALSRGAQDFGSANLSLAAGQKRFSDLLADLPVDVSDDTHLSNRA